MPEQAAAEAITSTPAFDFMWLELTNQCNLQCNHCYAESGPQGEKPTLSTSQFIELMTEAFGLGCRRIQFIGGEPVLNKDLPLFIRTAAKMGFEFIEVYTNLTILPEELLQCFVDHGVHVATSVYGPVGKPHDAITLVDGSWERTIKNLRSVLQAGLPARASIVEMESNAAYTDATVAFLREMGVQNVAVGRMRHLGRGAAPCETNEMAELCGNCAGGTICVSPSGVVAPCIMSKKWAVGSLSEASLSEIATGDVLRETRRRIYEAVEGHQATSDCHPVLNTRHAGCNPSYGIVDRRTECAPSVLSARADCAPSVLNARTECAPSVLSARADLACPPRFTNFDL